MNLTSEPARLALIVVLAAVASGGGYLAADVLMGPGEPPPPPAAEDPTRADRGPERGDRDDRGDRGPGESGREGHERHPEEPVQPSEDPIYEFWEDQHFPFLGFEKEKVSAAAVRASRPTGERQHAPDSMITIPGGEVSIGDANIPGSRPVRRAFVAAFRIDRYEVSNRRYRAFVRATARKTPYVHENWAAIYNWTKDDHPKGLGEVPVVMVTWKDAEAYCRWADRRLPTELEWEKAARGPEGRRYPWGDEWDSTRTNVVSRLSGPLTSEREWDAFEASWTGSKKPEIFRVGGYPQDRSGYGVMDMAGNVSEWVAGTFVAYPGAPPKDRVKLGSALRVARGNSWGNRDYSTPLAIRYPYEETRVDSVIGFRCAQDAQ